jgi:hypothetical protein
MAKGQDINVHLHAVFPGQHATASSDGAYFVTHLLSGSSQLTGRFLETAIFNP